MGPLSPLREWPLPPELGEQIMISKSLIINHAICFEIMYSYHVCRTYQISALLLFKLFESSVIVILCTLSKELVTTGN